MSHRNYHLGQRIECILKTIGMSKAEFGRRIATSRQNVNTLLRREALPTDMLMQVTKVLNYNFFEELSELVPSGTDPGSLPKGTGSEILVSLRHKPQASILETMSQLNRLFQQPSPSHETTEQYNFVLDRIYFGIGNPPVPDPKQ